MSEWSGFHKRSLVSLSDIQSYIERIEQRLAAANGRLEEYEEKICNCRWEGETLVRQCELHEAHVDAIHEWAERAKVAEQRLAAAEAKIPRWIPVGERMPKDRKPIYMIALVPERNYTTDQYAGWYILGEWSRWPHRFPPTHWSYQIDNPEGDS